MSYPGAERPTFEERLTDPLSHFPYKEDAARRAAGEDAAAHAEIDATASYVKAQEDFLRDPSEETRADERQAAQRLADVRRDRRIVRSAPAAVQALEAQLQQAESDQDGERLDALEKALQQAIQDAQDAAARLGLTADKTQEG